MTYTSNKLQIGAESEDYWDYIFKPLVKQTFITGASL